MTDQELDHFFQQPVELPAAVSERIRTKIISGATPVTPSLNGARLYSLFFALLVAVSLAAAAALGFSGWRALPGFTRIVLLIVLLGFTYWTAVMMARAMRPGAGIIYSWAAAGLAFTSYEVLVFTLFREYSDTHFLQRGVTCLSLGVACGLATMLPTWFVIRRGLVVQPGRAGALIGLLGGLAGLLSLTLHCSVLTIPHIAVWHAAVLICCVAAGPILFKPKPL